MNWTFKNILPLAATSLVSLTSLLNAADDAQMRNLENRVSALEQRKGANGMINPPARPILADKGGILITADALLWQAYEGGLDFAVKNANSTVYVDSGKSSQLHFDYDWGFRVGLGGDLPHDGWDVYLNWTHIHSHAKKSVSNVSDSGVTSGIIFNMLDNPGAIGGGFNTATNANAHWKLRLNMLDLELGREFYVSKWLTLRPNMGLRGVQIHDKFKASFVGGDVPSGTTNSFNLKNDFWGVGPRAGLNTQWGLGCGVSIFGDAAISLLYGQYSIKEFNNLTGNTRGAITNRFNFQQHPHATNAVTDLGIGLRYDVMFDDDNYHFGIQGGYEQHTFFSFNQRYIPIDDTMDGKLVSNLGDLSLHGWTLSVRFDF